MTSFLILVALTIPSAPRPTITIDDCPDHRHHRRTLQLLLRHRVKAIWFVNGRFLRNKRNRTLLRQLVRSKHRLGNHTYSHRYPCRLTARQFRVELRRNERAVNRTLGWPQQHRMKLYRPPFGQRCHTKLARRLGYRVMYWHRADIGSSVAKMIRSVRRRSPRNSILLFHRHNRKLQAVLRAFYPIPKRSLISPPQL